MLVICVVCVCELFAMQHCKICIALWYLVMLVSHQGGMPPGMPGACLQECRTACPGMPGGMPPGMPVGMLGGGTTVWSTFISK